MQPLQHARIRNAACAAIATLFLCVVELRAQATTPAAAAPPAYRELTDDAGRSVRVPQPVRRIVSLAPSITETIYALGLQDLLAGDTDYCDYPAEARQKPKVGGTINPNIEQVVALHPDLVLVTRTANRYDTLRALERLGIPTYATDPRNVDDIITSTQRLADALGAPEAGKFVAADLEHRLADLQQRLAELPPRRVLFVVWAEPLISIGRNTFIADALRRAGAVSIVESSHDWPQMNLEEIVRLQPEFLVFAASHSDTVPRDFEELASRPGWRALDAVRNRRYAVISDAVNRPAPRIVSAIEDLARQLHPEVFQEKPADNKEKNEKGSAPPAKLRSAASTSSPLLGASRLVAAQNKIAAGPEVCACGR